MLIPVVEEANKSILILRNFLNLLEIDLEMRSPAN